MDYFKLHVCLNLSLNCIDLKIIKISIKKKIMSSDINFVIKYY